MHTARANRRSCRSFVPGRVGRRHRGAHRGEQQLLALQEEVADAGDAEEVDEGSEGDFELQRDGLRQLRDKGRQVGKQCGATLPACASGKELLPQHESKLTKTTTLCCAPFQLSLPRPFPNLANIGATPACIRQIRPYRRNLTRGRNWSMVGIAGVDGQRSGRLRPDRVEVGR